MERVDYHLERLLPSVQLLFEVKLFTQEELQSFMHKRRTYETSLISRGVSAATYLDYIQLEENFERLTSLKLSRSPREGSQKDVITLKDRSKIRRFQEKHLISIWQRFITKLGRNDPLIYARYLQWLQSKKMKRVYSEVAAQSLSLHTSFIYLWIQVADWELNSNLDASAARSTLLRGIRLNSVTIDSSKRNAVVLKREGRRRKRQRKMRDADGNEELVSDSDSDGEDVAEQQKSSNLSSTAPSTSSSPLVLPETLPSTQLQLVDLWLAYLRMELVFLERLRRRWAVLGIRGGTVREVNAKGAAQEASEKKGQDEDEDEQEDKGAQDKIRPSRQEDEADRETRTAIESSAPTQILSGALLLRIVSSALGLSISSSAAQSVSSSPSLPGNVRFIFLAEALDIIAHFPFANHSDQDSEDDDGAQLRSDLIESIQSIIAPIKSSSPTSLSIVTLLYHQTLLSLSVTDKENRRDREMNKIDPEESAKLEREKLETASRLSFGQDPRKSSLKALQAGSALSEEEIGMDYDCLDVVEEEVAKTKSLSQLHEWKNLIRTENYLCRSLSQNIKTYLTRRPKQSNKITTESKIHFAQYVKTLLNSLRSNCTEELLLKALLTIWTQLEPLKDPLIPYISAHSDMIYADHDTRRMVQVLKIMCQLRHNDDVEEEELLHGAIMIYGQSFPKSKCRAMFDNKVKAMG
ncbi:unnamed protein product [Sympodiomycopsis kandeliae]